MNVKQEAINQANAELSNVGLPTYDELLAALRNLEWAVEGLEYVQEEYADEVASARDVLAKADS